MIIKDRLYGTFVITELVLVALIKCKAIQRLKKISQSGISEFVNYRDDITRYEHSIGVMLLLRKLNASVEEQIAGLIHDVPHTAFSHVVDYVFKNENHTFHKKHHKRIVMKSEIPAIEKFD